MSIDLLALNTPKTMLWIKTPSWRARDWVSVIVRQSLLPLSRKCLAHMLSRAHDIKKHLSTSTLWQMYVLHVISPSIRQQIWMASPTEKLTEPQQKVHSRHTGVKFIGSLWANGLRFATPCYVPVAAVVERAKEMEGEMRKRERTRKIEAEGEVWWRNSSLVR